MNYVLTYHVGNTIFEPEKAASGETGGKEEKKSEEKSPDSKEGKGESK
jgi:hypothetical protein